MKKYTLCLFLLIILGIVSNEVFAVKPIKIVAIFPETGIGTVDGLGSFKAIDIKTMDSYI